MVMPAAAFLKMNEEREKQGLPPAVNPRNAAAGTLRTVEPSIVAQRRLDLYAYFLLSGGEYLAIGQEATLDASDRPGVSRQSTSRDGQEG